MKIARQSLLTGDSFISKTDDYSSSSYSYLSFSPTLTTK